MDVECSTTTWTLSRQAEVDFSLITFVDGGSILAKSGAGGGRLLDFDGKRVAVISGTTTEKVLREGLAQRSIKAEIVTVKIARRGPEAPGSLEGRRIRVRPHDVDRARGGHARAARFRLLDEDFSIEPYALTLPRGDHEFRLAVNRVLARLFRGGEIVNIYNRWLGRLGPPSLLLSATYFVQGLAE